jgi:hypothetical protein
MKPKTPKVMQALESAIIVNLGGGAGLADPTAGVFVDGRKVQNVVAVQVSADTRSGTREVRLTLDAKLVTVVGHATVTANGGIPEPPTPHEFTECGAVGYPDGERRACTRGAGHEASDPFHSDGKVRWMGYHRIAGDLSE